MCGILGYLSVKENATNIETFYDRLLYIFKDLQREGGSYNNTDATGYFHPYIGVAKGNYKAEEAIKLPEFEEIKEYPVPQLFLGHVRKTTEGHPENNENNHPLWSDNWILIHNGGVESDIPDKDINDKYHMPGTVDSNHILACLEEYGIDKFRDHLKGVASIIFIPRNEKNTLYIYRDTRPMHIMRLGHAIWISSTKQSLLELAKIGEKKKEDILFKETYPMVELPTGEMWKIKVENGGFKYKKYEKVTLPSKPVVNTYTPRNNYGGYQGTSYNNNIPVVTFSLHITKAQSPRICGFCAKFLKIERDLNVGSVYSSCEVCYSPHNTFAGKESLIRGSIYMKDKFFDIVNTSLIETELIKELRISPIIGVTLFDGFVFVVNKTDKKLIVYNKNLKKGEFNWIISNNYTATNVVSSTCLPLNITERTNFWVSQHKENFMIYEGRPYVEENLVDEDFLTGKRIVTLARAIVSEFVDTFNGLSKTD